MMRRLRSLLRRSFQVQRRSGSSPHYDTISSTITDVFVRADVVVQKRRHFIDIDRGVAAMRLPFFIFYSGTSVMALAVTRKVTSICDRGQ